MDTSFKDILHIYTKDAEAVSINHIHYAGGNLDRTENLRKDDAWVVGQFANPYARIIPVWKDKNLVEGRADGNTPAIPIFYERRRADDLVGASEESVFLGMDGDIPVFAVDLSPVNEQKVTEMVPGVFLDLRLTGQYMAAPDASVLAYARGIMHWHTSHKFCGRCGHLAENRNGGHMRLCMNPDCGRETYPRTDPAVIMLVEHYPHGGGSPMCLMASHRRLPPRVYSTLAGFVEPGESLEEAVAREVMEEVGVEVTDVRYEASQPWPFPASIMLGFYATAQTTEIRVDEEELETARWFTADEILEAGAWEDESAAVRLPRRDSIARFLINTWRSRHG